MNEPKKFRLTTLHGAREMGDPLGGAVTIDNAALTVMSIWVSGPELPKLQVGQSQIREGSTADAYYYPDTRGTEESSTRKRIRYRVERVA